MTVFRILTLILLCTNICSSAYAQRQTAREGGPVRLGSILILTGEGSSWGVASRNGIDMAVDKINAEGGLLGNPISVDHQDTHSEPKKALSAFEYLTASQDIRLIIGPTWSSNGIPIIERADALKVLMISPSIGMAKFNESSEYLFNTWPHDFILSEQLARYVFDKGHRRVALIGAQEPWVKEQTEAFKKRFEELGGEIAYLTEPLPGTMEVKTEALLAAKSDADAVVSTTDGLVIGSLVAKALRALHNTLPIYSVTVDQAAIDAAQGGFEGMEFLTSLTPRPDFKEAYEKRFKTNIDIGADSAFDAVMLIAKAVRETNSADPTVIAKQLAQIKDYEGVSGHLVSDGKRGFTKNYVVMKVQNNRAAELR